MALSPDIMKTYGRIDIAFTHGKGSFLFSEDGSKYLDYATGIAVNAFGHSHPDLINALQDQASKLWHVSNLYKIPEQDKVANLLVNYSCANQAFFCINIYFNLCYYSMARYKLSRKLFICFSKS